MANYDFDAQPPISRDKVYVSWNETWPLHQYIEEYLKSRKLRQDDAARSQVHQSIARYPWIGPLRKQDVDFYLDSSLSKAELALPEAFSGVRKGSR